MRRLQIAAAFAVLLVAGLAGADNKPAEKSAPVKVKNFVIEGEELKGELPVPSLDLISPRKPAEHGSLIRVRPDFVREVVKSAEDL